MATNNIRTNINDLPLCEDMNLIDTLLALGTDGKTYRVDKNNMSGGGKWIPLTAIISSSGSGVAPMAAGSATPTEINVQLVSSELDEACIKGGKIHVIIYYNDKDTTYEDIEFLASPSYAMPMPGDIKQTVLLGRKYIMPFIYNSSMDIIHASLYNDHLLLEGVEAVNGDPITFEFKGIFFEPTKNIGDLSKVSDETSSSGGGVE